MLERRKDSAAVRVTHFEPFFEAVRARKRSFVCQAKL
jgi:hypothetical protein